MKIELKFKLVINDIGNKEVADIVGIRTVSNDEFLITKYKYTKVYADNKFILVVDTMDNILHVHYDIDEDWWTYDEKVRTAITTRYELLNAAKDDYDVFDSMEVSLHIANFLIFGKSNKVVIKDNAILAKHNDKVYMWTKCERGMMKNSVELNFFE
jgi:hypothetical protein